MPWDKNYFLTVACFIPSWIDNELLIWFDHKTRLPTPNSIQLIQDLVDEADVLSAQNLKYDLNILKYIGVKVDTKKLHCIMVTDYLLSGQDPELSFNLNAISDRCGIPPKLDVVKEEYWNKGLNTDEVPVELLEEYVLDDTRKVKCIREQQLLEVPEIQNVYNIQMEFTHVLSDIECNGLLWDGERAYEILNDNQKIIDSYISRLLEIAGEPRLNIGSGDQLSALIYGGKATVSWYEWATVEYKTQPYSKYYEKEFKEEIELPGLGFTPLRGSALKKDGYWSTNKDVIKQLKCKTKLQREVVSIILELSALAKANETILGKKEDTGLINKVQKDDRIHSKMNQTVTRTGRLSSSDPNGQNLPRGNTSPLKQCFISEY